MSGGSSGKLAVSKANQHVISSFTSDVHYHIVELTKPLARLFDHFKSCELDGEPKRIALRLFDEWCVRSQLPRFSEVYDYSKNVFNHEKKIQHIKDRLKEKLPFESEVIEGVVDAVGADLVADSKSLEALLSQNLWQLYQPYIGNFLQQTAHVIISRLLLHEVGVSKSIFNKLSIPAAGNNRYLKHFHNIREANQSLIEGVYVLSEFDWWYVPDIYRGTLKKAERDILTNIESDIDIKLSYVMDMLSSYDFSAVDRDVWKDVYLMYLSEEERRRLGFVPTPDEIVDLILDLAGYTSNKSGLCQAKLLDPACGSGTFPIEAILRLREHLENKMNCHSDVYAKSIPKWESQKRILDHIVNCIHAMDIHPFGAFLTTLNVLFLLLDLYADVKIKCPGYSLNLKIIIHDSLIKEPSLDEGLYRDLTNGRLTEALRRENQYFDISALKFDYVVGNPPWGGVLRGKLGPLGDEERRRKYKDYTSATGKYDIFVLFMERGIDWLTEKGILGMITQIMYVDAGFGKGIKAKIRGNASITHFIDVSQLAKFLFPGFSNYPAITIMKKGADPKAKLIKIRVDELK